MKLRVVVGVPRVSLSPSVAPRGSVTVDPSSMGPSLVALAPEPSSVSVTPESVTGSMTSPAPWGSRPERTVGITVRPRAWSAPPRSARGAVCMASSVVLRLASLAYEAKPATWDSMAADTLVSVASRPSAESASAGWSSSYACQDPSVSMVRPRRAAATLVAVATTPVSRAVERITPITVTTVRVRFLRSDRRV